MFFITETSKETTFKFSQNSVTIIQIRETQKIVNLANGSGNENSRFATTKNGMLLTVNQMVFIQKMSEQNL